MNDNLRDALRSIVTLQVKHDHLALNCGEDHDLTIQAADAVCDALTQFEEALSLTIRSIIVRNLGGDL